VIVRRDVELVVLTLVLGPPIGGLVFLFGAFGIDTLTGRAAPPSLSSTISVMPMVLVFSYILGGIPAALNAAATVVLSRFLRRPWERLIAAPLTGAALSVLGALWFVFSPAGGVSPGLFLSLIALTGAVSSLVCVAFIERFGSPLPAPKGAAT
jgi:hypothetical protein